MKVQSRECLRRTNNLFWAVCTYSEWSIQSTENFVANIIINWVQNDVGLSLKNKLVRCNWQETKMGSLHTLIANSYQFSFLILLKPTSLLISIGNILIQSVPLCSDQSSNLLSSPSTSFFLSSFEIEPEWSFSLSQQFLHSHIIPGFLPLERTNVEMFIPTYDVQMASVVTFPSLLHILFYRNLGELSQVLIHPACPLPMFSICSTSHPLMF